MVFEEAFGDQIEDTSALHHIIPHTTNEFGPQESKGQELNRQKGEVDSLCYILIALVVYGVG
jgi:hypothetical protein